MPNNMMHASGLNGLWKSALGHRANIRKAMIDYAVQMEVDESEGWRNPFRGLLDKYDDALLELQRKLTANWITAVVQEHAPNISIDINTVLDGMVDAMTTEDSETTTYDKPLVFDAQWILDYLNKNYINDKESVAYNQIVSSLYHNIGQYYIGNIGRAGLEKDGIITLPFYLDRWFRDENSISNGTRELMLQFDKLIQVVLKGMNAADVKPAIFDAILGRWTWQNKPTSAQLFRKIEITDEYSPVDWLRPNKGRSEVAIHFKDAPSAAKVADEIFKLHNK